MKPKQKRILLYSIFYFFIVSFAVVSLMINIKVFSLNEKAQKLTVQIQKMQETNQELYLQLLAANSMENIDAKATALGMKRPDNVQYLVVRHEKHSKTKN